MTFLAAGWLALFVPFAAVAWLALRRTPGEPATTTAAFLWRDREAADASVHSRPTRAPPWVWLALAALATAIVALAGPARRSRAADVVVVADPAARLATGGDASPLAEMFARVRAAAGDARIAFVAAGQPDARGPADVTPTARSTDAAIAATLARLTREGRPVVLLTDSIAFEPGAARAVVRPARRAGDIAIARTAARDVGDGVQVFVRITRDDRSAGAVRLVVASGTATVEQAIAWPADAMSVDVVVPLDRAGETIEASLRTAGDADPLNDRARLVCDAAGVRVALGGTLPDTVARLVTTLRSTRPPREDAAIVMLTDRFDAAVGPSVIVATGDTSNGAAGVLRRVGHPLLSDVPAELFESPVTGTPPAGFEAIAWRGGRPIVAVRDGPSRAAWVGLDAARPTPGWVVIVDAAIAWVAGGGGAWTSVTPDDVPASGWRAVAADDVRVEASPGLYRDASGRLRAVNANAGVPRGESSTASLEAFIAASARPADRSLAGAFAVVAALLAGSSATCVTLRRGRRQS